MTTETRQKIKVSRKVDDELRGLCGTIVAGLDKDISLLTYHITNDVDSPRSEDSLRRYAEEAAEESINFIGITPNNEFKARRDLRGDTYTFHSKSYSITVTSDQARQVVSGELRKLLVRLDHQLIVEVSS